MRFFKHIPCGMVWEAVAFSNSEIEALTDSSYKVGNGIFCGECHNRSLGETSEINRESCIEFDGEYKWSPIWYDLFRKKAVPKP